MPHPSRKISSNSSTIFRVILVTDRHRVKHILLGGGKKSIANVYGGVGGGGFGVVAGGRVSACLAGIIQIASGQITGHERRRRLAGVREYERERQ